MMDSVALQAFLRDYVATPPGMAIVVHGDSDALAVAVIDGVGQHCGYWSERWLIPELQEPALGVALGHVVNRVQRAVLAMCEFPERFRG